MHVGQGENDSQLSLRRVWRGGGGGGLTHMVHILICPEVKKHHERNPDMFERIKKKAFQMDREVIF